ncbi:hypothetical protein COCNU_06G004730 [Cocos nucifera]|uniref:AP complex mu/sigma subunit domain-containing protein n=1 Tax=Cocos nucifera TaxID=13894 RepID=A0A8K0N2Q1_COCNU|nr:hypothetical protein COCNU_06G004730 [Cocos nucifera]
MPIDLIHSGWLTKVTRKGLKKPACAEESRKGGREREMGIRFILLVNKQGQTRLAQYYEYLTLEGEIVRKCLARTEQQCSFVEHRNYKIVYRRYASLFFLVGVDNDEILRSLLKEWKAKVTVIHLTKLSLKELMSSLMTHALNMAQEEEEKPRKMKTIVFKSTAQYEESDESNEEEDEEESEDDDEDIELLASKFKKLLIKKSLKKKDYEERKERMNVICYNCNKRGHYKPNSLTQKASQNDQEKSYAWNLERQ